MAKQERYMKKLKCCLYYVGDEKIDSNKIICPVQSGVNIISCSTNCSWFSCDEQSGITQAYCKEHLIGRLNP